MFAFVPSCRLRSRDSPLDETGWRFRSVEVVDEYRVVGQARNGEGALGVRLAPHDRAMPATVSRIEAASRSWGWNPTRRASSATPPARSASEVRIHARKVRSLARL